MRRERGWLLRVRRDLPDQRAALLRDNLRRSDERPEQLRRMRRAVCDVDRQFAAHLYEQHMRLRLRHELLALRRRVRRLPDRQQQLRRLRFDLRVREREPLRHGRLPGIDGGCGHRRGDR